MKEVLLGPALVVGGIGWAALHVLDWSRWRSGKARLPWLGWSITPEMTPTTEMNRMVEGAAMIGNAVLGAVVALLGFAFILDY